jgi:hypothetical protein
LVERELNKKSYCMDILVILHNITKEWAFLIQIVIVCLSKPTTSVCLLNEQSNCKWNKQTELMASSIGILSRKAKVFRRSSIKINLKHSCFKAFGNEVLR